MTVSFRGQIPNTLEDLHNRQDLEEVVFSKVLVRMMRMQSPEVVDKDVEDAQNKNEQNRTELGLEADNNHDTRDQADQDDENAPEAPVTRKDEADEEEDEQHATSELDVHLTILLVHLRQTGRRKPLTDPGVGQNHEKTTQDGQVA